MAIFSSIKRKVNNTTTKMALGASAALAVVAPGYCTNGVNDQAGKIINMMFNLISVAGLVLVAVGIVQLVRAIIALTGGDQLQPGQLGKALGFIVAGIVAAGLKAILAALGINTSVSII